MRALRDIISQLTHFVALSLGVDMGQEGRDRFDSDSEVSDYFGAHSSDELISTVDGTEKEWV